MSLSTETGSKLNSIGCTDRLGSLARAGARGLTRQPTVVDGRKELETERIRGLWKEPLRKNSQEPPAQAAVG